MFPGAQTPATRRPVGIYALYGFLQIPACKPTEPDQSEKESRQRELCIFQSILSSRKSSDGTALPSSSYCSLCSPKTALTEVQTDILEAWPGSLVQARLWGCTPLSSQERRGQSTPPALWVSSMGVRSVIRLDSTGLEASFRAVCQ